MARCNELCTKDATGYCALCEALAERDRFIRFWFKGGWLMDGVRALKSRGVFAFFVSRRTSLLLGLGVLLLVFGTYGIYRYYWVIPNQQIASVKEEALTSKELNELRNSVRQTFVQALGVLGGLIGGAALLGGLYFTAQTLRTAQNTLQVNQETLRTTQQGQITERFTKAIEHVGDKERLMVRLGGIYALERIAKDSEYDHWAVMEVLTAFVREQPQEHKLSPQLPLQELTDHKGQTELRPRTDIQAILTVLRRRTRTFGDGETHPLDLRRTPLQGADLQGASLRGANLEGALLLRADLRGADLRGAHLQGAHLEETNLQGAGLRGADLRGAHLQQAKLQLAFLQGAHLQGADLREANLTQDQVNTVCVDEDTKLPDGLTKPPPCPATP
jgi:Pentapeptide repeats (8 copies)